MAYKAKPIILMSPSHRISEICTNLKPFEKEWLEKHRYRDELLLYHYTTLNPLRGILQDRNIWCSHVTSFNDPQELQYGKNMVLNRLNESLQKESNKKIIEFLKQLIMYFKVYEDHYDTFVACFCESNNLLSQWRGYSDYNGGYNVGFSFDSELNYSHDSNNLFGKSHVILRKIIYKPEDQNEIVNECITRIIEGAKSAINNWLKNNIDIPQTWETQAAMQTVNILYDMVLSFKNPAFKEENEWRLIKVMHIDKKFKPEIGERKGVLIPYINTFIFRKENDLIKFPLHSLKAGPMLETPRTEVSLRLLLKNIAMTANTNQITLDTSKVKISHAGYALRN